MRRIFASWFIEWRLTGSRFRAEPFEAFFKRDFGDKAEFGAGPVEPEPVRAGKLTGDEAGHGRLARQGQGFPEKFTHRAEAVGGFSLDDPARQGRASGSEDHARNDCPERHGLALGQKISLAGDG